MNNTIKNAYAAYTARLAAIRLQVDEVEQAAIALEREWTPDRDDWATVEALDERLSRLQRAEEACKKVLWKLEEAMDEAEWVDLLAE